MKRNNSIAMFTFSSSQPSMQLSKSLRVEVDEENARLEAAMKEAIGRHPEDLFYSQIDLQTVCADQKRFLRNMSLVGLASLLNHTLHQMARTAELFSPRKKSYNDPTLTRRPSDFEKLWIEFNDRFAFDLREEPSLIGFVRTLNDVRNRIVHGGGLANPPKFWQDVEQIDFEPNTPIDTDAFLDLKFSKSYSEFVDGEGALAEVSVSQKQLEEMVENACRLVDYCAEKIRARELVLAAEEENIRQGKIQ